MTTQQVFRDFDAVAAKWDQKGPRVELARAISDAMIRAAQPDKLMRVLDFGCGTGLVSLAFAPLVREVIAADSSKGMLEQLSAKLTSGGIGNVTPFLIPHQGTEALPSPVDLVVSSMTMHHIVDVGALIQTFRAILTPGGQLCIADLETEDGSFHDDPTGIAHHGFSSTEMEGFFSSAGFIDIRTVRVMEVRKQHGNTTQSYPVNLTVGRCRD